MNEKERSERKNEDKRIEEEKKQERAKRHEEEERDGSLRGTPNGQTAKIPPEEKRTKK